MLHGITEAMARASVGDLDVRIPVAREADLDDPLVAIAHMLNVLLGDLQQRQRESEQALHLMALSEAKDRFLATMSHEIRTPMTVMLGMLSLLSRTDLDERQHGYLREMRNAGDHLLGLIDDVLDMSKVQSGTLEFREAPFHLDECVDQAVRLVSASAERAGLELEVHVDTELAPEVVGDSSRLRQVLVNLLANAVKFTEQGSVDLRVSSTPVADGRVLVAGVVTDTGIGIASDSLALVFEPFAQADSSSTRRRGGTGLGLAICRHIVEAMEGQVEVDSTPGRGSSFRFHVMLEAAAPAPAEGEEPGGEGAEAGVGAAQAPRQDDRPMRILLVEDNAALQMMVTETLGQLGYRDVSVASNGREGAEAALRERFDVVLMDMRMPVMDGLESTREIRSRWSEGDPPMIIALTANAFDSDRDECIAAGMDEFLAKPFDPARLDALLRQAGARRAR